MISVVYDRESISVTMKGHALSGEAGQDLVCASASILAYTLAANVTTLEEQGFLKQMSIKLNPGDAEIKCIPESHYKYTVAVIFNSVCAGFALLAHDYPDNISCEIKGCVGRETEDL